MSFELFIGRRYLRTKQRQAFISLITFLSIAGVTVGVMALIVVIAVMTGGESYFRSSILGVESHIVLMRHGGDFSDYRTILERIKKIKGIDTAAPFVYTQVMLRSSSMVSGAVLRGIDPEAPAQEIKSSGEVSIHRKLIRDTDTGTTFSVPGVILGDELANNLGVMEGDTIYLISSRGMLSPVGHMPAMKQFKVVGRFKSGMLQYDESVAYIHMKDAQKIMRMGDTVSGIGIRVTDIYNAKQIADEIVKDLGYPYWARDWMQMNQNLFSALRLEKKMMFIILTLIILVAAFNISSTLIMMVMGKTKDIAILKAMGATDSSIRKIFVFKGMVIGFIGTVLGISTGFVLCTLLKHYKFIELPGDVYYFTTLPVQVEVLDVIIIASAAMVICFLATLYPAYQASKLDPVEAIRYG